MPKPAKTIKEYFRESISNAKLFFELYDVNLCKVDIPDLSCIKNVYSCKHRRFRKFDQRRVDKINKQPELLVVMEKGEDFIADEVTYTVYYMGHNHEFFSFDLAGKYIKLNHE